MTAKNVHTEHCCKFHGCKYGDYDCPVLCGRQSQSFPCEECDNDRSIVHVVSGTPSQVTNEWSRLAKEDSQPS